jgi:outer membrane protein assembly factor BamD (BamD/ComL family)
MANADRRTRRTIRRHAIVAAAAFALLAPGCKSWHGFKERAATLRGSLFDSAYEDPRAEEKFADGVRLFEEEQYDKAREVFRGIADNQMNSADLAERARFMQAECRFMRRQYPEAADTYHKLLLDFPTGAHRRQSCTRIYEIADYWLDDFRTELERRADEKGVLRWRPKWPNPMDRTRPMIDQEGRMLEAFERIHTQDVTGPAADKAIFWCGYVNFIRGNFQEADHFFSQLVELHKESPLRPQAIAYAIQAKNNATGGAEYDGRKCAEALQLVHVAEATVPELTQNPEMAAKLTRAKRAIRSQQAEKDFRTAEYYERTGHPGSAVFYYELVRRRYAATKYADIANERKEHLLAAMREGRPLPGNDPFAIIGAKWKEMFATPQPVGVEDREPSRNDPKLGPPAPVSVGVAGGGPYQLGPVNP